MAVDFETHISSQSKLTDFIKLILSKTSRTTDLINQLAEKVQCEDVLFYTWKTLVKFLSGNDENCDVFMLNILELLEKISVSKIIDEGEKRNEHQALILTKGSEKFFLDKVLLKNYVKKVWQFLINREMSPAVHKKLLFILLELYILKLKNPIFLTDFLMSSLNVKGVVQILALQGVATLMQKHNIEYPNIYGKLYMLFEPNVFHTKYKSRLFYLANIFLSSTHLPESLVASFAKRASRLSLSCASPDILIILRFVGNLLMRHTGLIKMIHHSNVLEVLEDPFLENENDPLKTRASESSLWEISLLNSHCQPSISSAAKFIHFKLPSLEFDIGEVLDNSYVKAFELECKKTKKIQASVTFQRPQDSIGKLRDDQDSKQDPSLMKLVQLNPQLAFHTSIFLSNDFKNK